MQIGIFDSGIGGASIAKSIIHSLSQYKYVYFADDANMPYGDKDEKMIFNLTTNSLTKLFDKDCKIVILACNTATTVLSQIQQHWLPRIYPDRKVLGIIRPTVENMVRGDKNQSIFVLATARTVASKAYDHEIQKIGKTCNFTEISCPKLATVIEKSQNIDLDPQIYSLCTQYVGSIPNLPNVTIYLGCTHFSYVADIIHKLRPLAKIVNQGPIVSTSFSQYLENHLEIKSKLTTYKKRLLEVSCSSNNKDYIKRVKELIKNEKYTKAS